LSNEPPKEQLILNRKKRTRHVVTILSEMGTARDRGKIFGSHAAALPSFVEAMDQSMTSAVLADATSFKRLLNNFHR
jgi:hypothetical protein